MVNLEFPNRKSVVLPSLTVKIGQDSFSMMLDDISKEFTSGNFESEKEFFEIEDAFER